METFAVAVFPVAKPDQWQAFADSIASGERADAHRQFLRRLGVKREHVRCAVPAQRRRGSALRLTPAPDRLVHSRDVIAQGEPDLPEGHRLPWSQIHGLGANVIVPRLESTPRDDVDSDAQKFLKILEQADVIKKGSAWLPIHEQVEIAVWTSLSPSDRTEHRDPMSPAPPRDTEDLRSAAAQPFQLLGTARRGGSSPLSIRARRIEASWT